MVRSDSLTVLSVKTCFALHERRKSLDDCHRGARGCFRKIQAGKNGEVLPLRWRVLAVIPEKTTGSAHYREADRLPQYLNRCKDITWAECDLQKWLNNEFLKEAFTEQEREKIYLTKNKNPDNKKYEELTAERIRRIRVFLLSLDETEKYFGSDIDRRAAGTDYAINQRLDVSDDRMGWWWLRSPGIGGNYAACVIRAAASLISAASSP